ncbi:hypothetical protein OHB26_06800 [Nocardia sp. NBC_01503]|uniref:hypothetical protein n=1 Tax=Nocardia sp. NBC_01503 TaxID=2975997 RepID=UPI002E7BAAE2|nr:hypothetical protein [Nocardia sp. NBC_01503]WTL33919.1 hypothetical protein OHB26_06800 [Nocardia sp. NBC_01503]
MKRSVLAACGAFVAIATLTACGSTTSGTATTASTNSNSSAAMTTPDRAAGLGQASKTTCAALLAKSNADKQALLRQVIAENPNWKNFGSDDIGISWAEMNCKGNGKETQAIGVALEVAPSTAASFKNVATMTCHDFFIQDTDDDTGIALMQQLTKEKPELGGAGPFPTLIWVREECKKPGSADKVMALVAK